MAITNTSSTGVKLPYTNKDGLRWQFGRDEATMGKGGEFSQGAGSWHLSEFYVTFTDVALGTDDTHVYVLDFNNILPASAVIDSITFQTGALWATDTAINFGIVKSNEATPGTFTIVDADGLVNSIVLAARDADGETTTMTPGGTYAGALMGVQAGIGFDGLICTYFEGSAPTAGTGNLRIYWRDNNFVS